MSEEILEEGVLIGNPVDGWERVVKKMRVNDTEGNKVMIQKGHGLTDISCRHGSRWIWFPQAASEFMGYGQVKLGLWRQVIYAPSCDCDDPPKPYKIQVSRIRKPYFDAIVSGDKGEELKALSPYWIRRLIETENPPNVMKFICGKCVHSRKITKIFKDKAKTILGGVKCEHCGTLYTEKEFEKLELTGHNILWDIDYRRCGECGGEITPICEQGRIDLQLDMYDGYCIVVKLGEEVKA